MAPIDFPLWFAAGSYGGLACALLAAVSVSLLALRLRRGTRRQIAFAFLTSIIAFALMLAPVWWLLRRFEIYGPAVSSQEVTFWLLWISLFGWITPLVTTAAFFALASPEALGVSAARGHLSGSLVPVTALDDPARESYPYGPERPWGQLTLVEGEGGEPPIELLAEVTLIGRDPGDDVILDDDLVSRSHAELRWRTGNVYLLDRGSLNGTRRNAQSARGLVQLDDGDILQFGARRYRFVLAPALSAEVAEETRKVASSHASHPLSAPLALVVENGASAGVRWEPLGKVTTIGRDPAADITIQDSSVSRFHAQIARQTSGYYLTDLESSNGVTVNGAPVNEPRQLVSGDVLGFGEIRVRCESGPSPAESAAASAPELSVSHADAPAG
jgi:pSer/pThr/pTyr-binding forkhead associated (FHA) protein